MPASEQNYNKITEYQNEAAKLNTKAAGYAGGAEVLGDKVMEAVRADRTARGVSKLATDVGNVSGQMVTDPNAIREGPQSLSGQGLVDPFSVNQLTSNARAQNLKTLGTVATQQLANQGGIDEVIQAGANQLKAKAAAMLAKAEEATAMAQSLQGDWEREFEEKQFTEGVRQFNVSANQKSGEGSGPSDALIAFIEKYLPKEETSGGAPTQPTEEAPNFTPFSGEGTVVGKWVYKGGQWVENGPSNSFQFEGLEGLANIL